MDQEEEPNIEQQAEQEEEQKKEQQQEQKKQNKKKEGYGKILPQKYRENKDKISKSMKEILEFRKNLPIHDFYDQIIEQVSQNNFVVITGDTGSGKSTQLPQYLFDSDVVKKAIFGILDEQNAELPQIKVVQDQEEEIKQKEKVDLKKEDNEQKKLKKLSIITTQPRKVAAISMAKRICSERDEELGGEVGYTVRFDDKTSKNTKIKYVTDGILVRECLSDRNLSKYNIVILDEAHERSLYTDVLFALVKQAVQNRKGELRLITTSATLNTEQFSKYFNNCPVLKMTGRSYPVEIKYNVQPGNRRVDESVKSAIRMHLHEGPGDILVFLTGKEECEVARRLCIQKLSDLVQTRPVAKALIYTLYGTQHTEDQQQVFKKAEENTRKIIFSTNIAETSLTIDGIGFVVDCGFVKQKSYNPRTGMDALIVVPISKVQAIQRCGRAGRTQEGKCFRLYSEQFYKDQMKENTVPEILRVNLSNVILSLKNMNIPDVVNFDYMEKPDNDTILQALRQLYLLDAIDESGDITYLGQQMCRFPLEPSYSKALITSILFGVEEKMVSLVSMLSTEQIWSKPPRVKEEEYQQFEKTMLSFLDIDGDHETLLKIRKRWIRNNYSESFCRQNFLNSRALKQCENIRVQLLDLVKGTNISGCKPFYKEDHLYKLWKNSRHTNRDKLNRHPKHGYKKSKDDDKEEKELTPSMIFRMAVTNGFFFNSARKVHNAEEAYILVFTESGNMVEVDPQSVYVIQEHFPQCVVYTELGGLSTSKGVIRLLSEIDLEWVNGYQKKYNSVDVFKLAGLKKQDSKDDLIRKRKEQSEQDKKNQEKSKDDKKREALLKFEQRKKQKLNNQKSK